MGQIGKRLIVAGVKSSASALPVLMTEGPEKALISLASSFLGEVASDFTSRPLSKVQDKRVVEGIDYIRMRFQAKIDDGEPIQNPLFQSDMNEEPREILEGVLFKLMNEYQTKKHQYIANLWVNWAFKNIPYTEVVQMLHDIEVLSYYDLCIIALWGNLADINGLPNKRYQGGSTTLELLLRRIVELVNRGILDGRDYGIGGIQAINPQTIELQDYGRNFYSLFELKNIPPEETHKIARTLQE